MKTNKKMYTEKECKDLQNAAGHGGIGIGLAIAASACVITSALIGDNSKDSKKSWNTVVKLTVGLATAKALHNVYLITKYLKD